MRKRGNASLAKIQLYLIGQHFLVDPKLAIGLEVAVINAASCCLTLSALSPRSLWPDGTALLWNAPGGGFRAAALHCHATIVMLWLAHKIWPSQGATT